MAEDNPKMETQEAVQVVYTESSAVEGFTDEMNLLRQDEDDSNDAEVRQILSPRIPIARRVMVETGPVSNQEGVVQEDLEEGEEGVSQVVYLAGSDGLVMQHVVQEGEMGGVGGGDTVALVDPGAVEQGQVLMYTQVATEAPIQHGSNNLLKTDAQTDHTVETQLGETEVTNDERVAGDHADIALHELEKVEEYNSSIRGEQTISETVFENVTDGATLHEDQNSSIETSYDQKSGFSEGVPAKLLRRSSRSSSSNHTESPITRRKPNAPKRRRVSSDSEGPVIVKTEVMEDEEAVDTKQQSGDMTLSVNADEADSRHSRYILKQACHWLQEGRFLDVTLVCGGWSLKAHRIVLTAYSAYLNTLLSQEDEDVHSLVTLDQDTVTGPSLKALVEFMYTGKFTDSVHSVSKEELLEAAKSLGITKAITSMDKIPKKKKVPTATLR